MYKPVSSPLCFCPSASFFHFSISRHPSPFILPFIASMLQFQEQLGQGCSPEESDTFQAQGTSCKESQSLNLTWMATTCLTFLCFILKGSEILDQMLQCLEHLPKPMPQLEVSPLIVHCNNMKYQANSIAQRH